MLRALRWAARLQDAWIGRCCICATRCRNSLCDACSGSPALRWRLLDIPAWSATQYDGRIRELIHRIKYLDETRWAAPLGRVLHERVSSFISPHCTLIPVPLHPRRLADRGYNQAALIARTWARHAEFSISFDALQRIHFDVAQAGLGAVSRQDNVSGAFRVGVPPAGPVVLVDDVATTGATLRECVLCLRRAGAIVEAVVTVALAGADRASPFWSPFASGCRDGSKTTAPSEPDVQVASGDPVGAIHAPPGT